MNAVDQGFIVMPNRKNSRTNKHSPHTYSDVLKSGIKRKVSKNGSHDYAIGSPASRKANLRRVTSFEQAAEFLNKAEKDQNQAIALAPEIKRISKPHKPEPRSPYRPKASASQILATAQS